MGESKTERASNWLSPLCCLDLASLMPLFVRLTETRGVAASLPKRKDFAMTGFAPVFSARIGCKYRPKKAPRSKTTTMLLAMAGLSFVLPVCFIGGVLLGLISKKPETPAIAQAAVFHQIQRAALAVDSIPQRATKVAAKRKDSPKALAAPPSREHHRQKSLNRVGASSV